ncbi:hypothetical protein [Aurantimonas sp. 22II-16-19i]|uniref:TipJ family phage tail tip protein n=1 Tax=Aurantimonas sp. 22II-16-19i TaxID=1317114 RepID=UPI0009F7F2E4|nr:hypothetical protein [Aurantimonas sp. 22II-16-19i]ORE87828.1 phage tail fiber protein [Aurantimonas sp. 22II-16-19i]
MSTHDLRASTSHQTVFVSPPIGRAMEITIPHGLTVGEMIDRAIPDVAEADRSRLRVILWTPRGDLVVERERWHVTRPKPGVKLLIRPIPGKNALRIIAQIVVAVAAIAIAGPLAGTIGTFGATLLAAGLTYLGNMLIGLLFPVKAPDQQRDKGGYRVTGLRNEARPGAAIPSILGEIRVAPQWAMAPYTEVVGNTQYIRAIAHLGYGPLLLDEWKIGDTPLEEYDEVELEIREGLPDDEPLTLVTRQVIEDSYNTDLTNRPPEDDFGDPIEDAENEAKEVVRYTASDISAFAVILGWPSGSVRYTDEAEDKPVTVDFRVRARKIGASTDAIDTTFSITEKRKVAMFRQREFEVPERGSYEIGVTRLNGESDSVQVQDKVQLTAIQSIRPEYPIAAKEDLCLTGIRIKATAQLSGGLDRLECRARRVIADHDVATEAWIPRPTRNPASHFVHACRGPEIPAAERCTDDMIDWPAMVNFHAFCVLHGLEYDEEHRDAVALPVRLAAIASAGRAAPRWTGTMWTVVIDRPDTAVVDSFSPQDAWDFRWEIRYPKLPDGYRVTFADRTNDNKVGERVIPFPGIDPDDVETAEERERPGKTNPDEVWRESRREQYEALYRNRTLSFVARGRGRPAVRGKTVAVSYDQWDRTLFASRVDAVEGRGIVLSDPVEMEAGESYAVRFWQLREEEDGEDVSIVRDVATMAGEHRLILLEGEGPMPEVDHVVHFGVQNRESIIATVLDTEPGERGTTVYTVQPEAPLVDQLTDAEVPPAWDGRVGAIVAIAAGPPAKPRVAFVLSIEGVVMVGLQEGTGSIYPPATFVVQHRTAGTADPYLEATAPAYTGSVVLPGYAVGDQVELRANALGTNGDPSPFTVYRVFTIVDEAPAALAPPTGLSFAPDDPVTGPASTTAFWTNGNDGRVSVARVYRAPLGGLFEDAVAVSGPLYGGPLQKLQLDDAPGYGIWTYFVVNEGAGLVSEPVSATVRILGPQLSPNVTLDSATGVTLGPSWSISAGTAKKASASTSTIAWAVSVSAGVEYLLTYDLIAIAGGNARPRLEGGSLVQGDLVGTPGPQEDRLTAATGNTTLSILAGAGVTVEIDNVSLRRISP